MSVQAIDSIQRILDIFVASEAPIRPHFILTGPSVSGESHTIQALAEDMEIGIFDINAAGLTKEGTSGNSLSKALTPLLHQYFIEGGIKEKSTKKVTFQKTLSL